MKKLTNEAKVVTHDMIKEEIKRRVARQDLYDLVKAELPEGLSPAEADEIILAVAAGLAGTLPLARMVGE